MNKLRVKVFTYQFYASYSPKENYGIMDSDYHLLHFGQYCHYKRIVIATKPIGFFRYTGGPVCTVQQYIRYTSGTNHFIELSLYSHKVCKVKNTLKSLHMYGQPLVLLT